jgi:hypothetical protein
MFLEKYSVKKGWRKAEAPASALKNSYILKRLGRRSEWMAPAGNNRKIGISALTPKAN